MCVWPFAVQRNETVKGQTKGAREGRMEEERRGEWRGSTCERKRRGDRVRSGCLSVGVCVYVCVCFHPVLFVLFVFFPYCFCSSCGWLLFALDKMESSVLPPSVMHETVYLICFEVK